MNLPTQLEFLKSVRFWKLFTVAVVQFLASQGIVTPEISNGISLLLLGSVAVRTIDRAGENIGYADTNIYEVEAPKDILKMEVPANANYTNRNLHINK